MRRFSVAVLGSLLVLASGCERNDTERSAASKSAEATKASQRAAPTIYTAWPFDTAEARRRQEETARALGVPVNKTLDLGGGVTMRLALIPAGTFAMGSPGEEHPPTTFMDAFEKLHEVTMSRPFYIGTTEVTQSQWTQVWSLAGNSSFPECCSDAGPILPPEVKEMTWGGDRYLHMLKAGSHEILGEVDLLKAGVTNVQLGKIRIPFDSLAWCRGWKVDFAIEWDEQGPMLPASGVPWNRAVVFSRILGAVTKTNCRLPTEAEWEYACRAGSGSKYCLGGDETALFSAGWYEANSGNQVKPVQGKQPNAWGLWDVHGNVREWVADWSEYSHVGVVVCPVSLQGPVTDPLSNGVGPLQRGGCAQDGPYACRAAYRGFCGKDGFEGLRVVSDIGNEKRSRGDYPELEP